MSKITEIIKYRSESQKVDFLEYLLERGIDSDEKEEVISIILSYFPDHNDWSLVLLIDLSSNEQLISRDLLNIYLSGLLTTKTLYIKLSILDYLNATRNLYAESNIHIDLNLLEKLAYDKKSKLIVRNQALFTLMKFSPLDENIYLSQLKENLIRTNDYRAQIRFYNNLLLDDFYTRIPKTVLFDFIKISKSKDLGRAVESTIEELELKLS